MTRRRPIFLLLAIAGIGAAFARPLPQSVPADGERIAALVARHGDVLAGHETIGNALSIYTVSSKSCRGIKILPVSVLLQESALLKGIGADGDHRYFVYLQDRWSFAGPPPVAPQFVLQQFLQMARIQPRLGIDTMLYFVVPKNCASLAPGDWSDFWRPAAV